MTDYSTVPHHPWYRFRNQQLHWVPGDTLEQWQNNMADPARRKVLEKYGWNNPEAITYKFNSHGFRCAEFNNDPALVTIGCSFTGGLALPYDHIWPTLAADQLKLACVNLGVAGVGMDTCFRLLHFYIEKLNAKVVGLLCPEDTRFEWTTTNGEIEYVSPYTINHDYAHRMWYQHENNGKQNFIKNLMAIKYLCLANQIKLVVLHQDPDLFNTPAEDPWPPGRDLAHVGSVSHKECARRFVAACEES